MMPAEIDHQAIVDEEHLKLLYWGYIVSGAFAALFSFFGLFYVVIGAVMGLAISTGVDASSKSVGPAPAFVGVMFAGIGLVFFAVAATAAILKFITARNLRQRKSKVFCTVIAGLTCLEFPYGMLLGVMTFIVLGRESVAKIFEVHGPASSAAG